jgi:hypothetical protein
MTTQEALNQQHVDNPQPGDLWTERYSIPYHVVLAVSADRRHITLCRKKMDSGPAHFTFDVTQAETITLEEHAAIVTYRSLPGPRFVADVRPDRLPMVVDEWVKLGRPVQRYPTRGDLPVFAIKPDTISVSRDFLTCLSKTFEFIDGCNGIAVLDPIARKEQHEELKRLLSQ